MPQDSCGASRQTHVPVHPATLTLINGRMLHQLPQSGERLLVMGYGGTRFLDSTPRITAEHPAHLYALLRALISTHKSPEAYVMIRCGLGHGKLKPRCTDYVTRACNVLLAIDGPLP